MTHSAEEVVERLRQRVAQRRQNGEYADDLEERLDAHYRRIVFHRVRSSKAPIENALANLDNNMDFSMRPISIQSGVPGGEMLHRTINKTVDRHREVMLDQIAQFANATRETLRVFAESLRDPSSHVHADLVGQIDAILERLDSYERRPVSDEAALGDLRRRVEQLERRLAGED